MRDPALRALTESLTHDEEQRLTELRLLRGSEDRSRSVLTGTLAAMLLAVLGGTKLSLGLARDKPVFFLAGLMLLSLVALLAAMPRGRPTRLGRQLLQKARDQFAWATPDLQAGHIPRDVSPALCFAVLGMGALTGPTAFEPFRKAFQASQATSAAGGCGGGCGSGGGCGGGGCGGCGS